MSDSAATLEELVKTGAFLSGETDFRRIASALAERALDVTRADLSAVYLYAQPGFSGSDIELECRRGAYRIPASIPGSSGLVSFIEDCRETVVISSPEPGPFSDILLSEGMESGIALPLRTRMSRIGILILDSRHPSHFTGDRFTFLDSLAAVASGILQNARLYGELRDYVKRAET